MPPVVLSKTPVDTEGLDATQDGVRNLSLFEPRAIQKLLLSQQTMQVFMQCEAQSFRAVPSLQHTLTAQAAADFQRLMGPVASLIKQTTAAQAHTALLTEHARFPKTLSSITEENTGFQQFQKEMWAPLPLIDSQWTETQERLQTLWAPWKAIQERVCETFQPVQQKALQVQEKLQGLAAPFQAFFQDWKARTQPFINWMASEAYRKRAQRMSDIIQMVGAYCPIYRESYPEYQQEDWINAALTRLIAQLHPGLRKPCAAKALRQQAAAQHTSPQDFLRTVVFPKAIRLVAHEVTTPQRMRLGRKWVTNRRRKILAALPGEELPPYAFADWFFSQVYAAAVAIVLYEAYPRPTTQQAQVLVYKEDALERLMAPESPGARDSAMLTALLQAEEMDPADRFHGLLTIVSPREKELLLLLYQGRSRDEAAQVMGIKRSTVDVFMHRIYQKARRR